MGNTPSTPPPLFNINAPGNEIHVPYGTSLYARPPPTPGYHPPHTHYEHQGAIRAGTSCETPQCCQGVRRGPVYSKVGEGPRRGRHGYVEPDVRIREYEEESESTELGEVRLRRKEGKMQDMRRSERRGAAGPYTADPRPNSAPVGYAGLRGGEEHLGMFPGADGMAMSGMVPYARIHPGMYPGVYPGVYSQGAIVSPHPSVPPQYTSHAPMPGYSHGISGAHNANAFAPQSSRPPPPSTAPTSTNHKSRSKPLPSVIQAAIDEAIQKSTGTAHMYDPPLTRSRTSPATFAKVDDGWGGGIDTCICTTNCKCRKGERGIKWYEGTAKIGDEDVPVRAKLNTRFVLKDDIGKDCGDHSGCKKKVSSSSSLGSSTSDMEISAKTKRKDKKKAKKAGKDDKFDNLQAELDKMKQTAALKQGDLYGPSPFAGYGPGNQAGYDPEMMRRIMEISDPYRIDRVGGMDVTGKTSGMYDSMTAYNPRLPRMPPKPGMWARSKNDGYAEHRGDMGGASPFNPYARPNAMDGKGRDQPLIPPRRGDFRGDPESDSEPSISNRGRHGKKRGLEGGRPRRQSALRGFGSDGDEEHAMYNLPKRGNGGKNGSGSPQDEWLRISSPRRRGGMRKGRTAGKQARVETDGEDC